MSWKVVARKDVEDAIRSYWLWGLTVLFVAFFATPAYFFADQLGAAAQEEGVQLSSTDFISVLAEVNAFFVPIIAIVLAYAAIAGERDDGTLKLLLSLPHSRRDVVAGKVLGRGAVVVAALLAGFVAAAVVFLATPVGFEAGNYVLFALLTALLALAFVGLAVGLSAAARTDRWAMIATVSTYVVFTLFWNRFTDGAISLLTDHAGLEGAGRVELHLLLKVLNPTQAYKSLAYSINTPETIQVGNGTTLSGEAVARTQLMGGGGFQAQITRQMYTQSLGSEVPVFLTDPFLVLLLIAWLVGVPVVGYYVFEEADL